MSDRSETPLVSLGVPVFNGEQFLVECLDGLVAQDYTDIEIIVSDNGSTDATQEIVRDFCSRDERIVYERHEENRGAAWNYNNCVHRSRGAYFSWTAHDDVRPPKFVSASIEGFRSVGGDAASVYGTSDFIDETGALIGPDEDELHVRSSRPHVRLAAALASVNFAAPVFGLLARDVLDRTRLIDSFAASDYVLICELAMLGPIVQIEEMTLGRRLHPGSSREANRSRADVVAWFDPSGSQSRLSDRQRLLLEYERSVGRLGLGWSDRALCRTTIPLTIGLRRARVTGGALRDRIFDRPDEPHPRDIMDKRNMDESARAPQAESD
jgi:glycosyltransferase involved in cell wall biosynthesis